MIQLRQPAQTAAHLKPVRLRAIVRMLGTPVGEPEEAKLTAVVNAAFDEIEAREEKEIRETLERLGLRAAASDDPDGTTYPERLYGLFKFLSDDTRGRPTWERLRREIPGLDRDRVVLHLWTLLEDRYPDQVRSVGASLPYHRVWLADRFLERYDVRRSRRALGSGGLAGWAHVALLAVLAGLFWARRQAAPDALPWLAVAWPVAAAVGLAFLVVAGGLAWSFREALDAPGLSKLDRCLEPVLHAFQSLLPRLAAAGLVGLVILASSQELLELLTCKLADSGLVVQVLVVVLPLAGGYLYLLLEMTRRVQPLPALRHLLGRAFDVWATALAHALAITLVAERGLGKILDLAGPFPGWAAFRVAVFVFIIGLVVNLVWAETPVTQPL